VKAALGVLVGGHSPQNGSSAASTHAHGAARQHDFVVSLLEGRSFRRAARFGGLERPQAKMMVRRLGAACTEYQRRLLARYPRTGLRRAASRAFFAKDHMFPASRRDEFEPTAVWTHLLIDDASGLVSDWYVGPNRRPDDTSATECVAEELTDSGLMRVWSGGLGSGLLKKANEHAACVGLFVMCQNFVGAPSEDQVTPAMRAQVASRSRSVDDILALVI
jgi:hypothetical protein